MTKTDASTREGEERARERERKGAIQPKQDGDGISYSRRHRDGDRHTRARGRARGTEREPAVAYTRHYAPRDATASQVSREGIRPISINGQGDTCCLIVTDGYAQLTALVYLWLALFFQVDEREIHRIARTNRREDERERESTGSTRREKFARTGSRRLSTPRNVGDRRRAHSPRAR